MQNVHKITQFTYIYTYKKNEKRTKLRKEIIYILEKKFYFFFYKKKMIYQKYIQRIFDFLPSCIYLQ